MNGNLSTDQNWNWNWNWNSDWHLNPNSIFDKPSNAEPSRASVALLLRYAYRVYAGAGSLSDEFTEYSIGR